MERRSSSQSEDEYSSLELSASGDQVRSAERTSRTMEPQQLTSGYQNQCDEEEIAKTIARDLPRAQKKQKKRRIEEVEGYERKRRRQRERERSGKEQFQQVRRKGGRSGEGLKLYKEAKGGAEDRAGCGTEWERVSGESMTAGEGGIGRAKGNTGKEFAPAGESTSAIKLKLTSRERSSKYRQKKKARERKLEDLVGFLAKNFEPTFQEGAIPAPSELQIALDDLLSRERQSAAKASEAALRRKETELRSTEKLLSTAQNQLWQKETELCNMEKLLSTVQNQVVSLQNQISVCSRRDSNQGSAILEKLNSIIDANESSRRDCISRIESTGEHRENISNTPGQREVEGGASVHSGRRVLLETLINQVEGKKKKTEVRGLGAGTYGEIYKLDGTTDQAIKIFKPESHFYPTMASELAIGAYAPGIPNVMIYEPVYTDRPIGVVMECMNMDLEKLLSLIHYQRWVKLFECRVPQTYQRQVQELSSYIRLLSVASKRMIHALVISASHSGGWKEEERVPVCEMEVLNLFIQLAKGLKHLHDARFIHGDIKTRNILVRMPDGNPKPSDVARRGYECPRAELLLADLGGAKRWEEGTCGWKYEDRNIPVCTYTMMAPEMWGVWFYERGMVTSISDVWSLGCVFLEIWVMFFGDLESHPRGYFQFPWLQDAYENRALDKASARWKLRCWEQAFAAWGAPTSRIEGRADKPCSQRQSIEKWRKVGESLSRSYDVFSNGKGSLRRNLLFYILNCVMQPEQHMRQTAEEVLMTLESWEKELHDVASDELHTARTISVPFIKVCQMYGRMSRRTVNLDLPGANEVLRPPKLQEIAPRTSLRSVPAAVGAPYRMPYARAPGDAQAARRPQGKKVYDELLFKGRQ